MRFWRCLRPGLLVKYSFFKGSKNLRYRLVLRYTPRYLLEGIFSMASKNLRYRSISASLWGNRFDPYRKYNLKEHYTRDHIAYI